MLKRVVIGSALSALVAPGLAYAQAPAQKVLKAPAPKWALPPPVAAPKPPPQEAAIEIRFLDNQIRLSKKGQEAFVAQRFKILRPDALQAANLRFLWRPAGGTLTVHSIRLHRRGQAVAEMLDKAEFQVIQREENLEQSVLTGVVTAAFAIPGVEVGDEVDFAATIFDRDPTLDDKTFGMLQLPVIEMGGAYRARLLVSDGVFLNRKISSDLAENGAVKADKPDELTVEVANPGSANIPEGAPPRYGVAGLVEYSSFAGWPQISSMFWMYFEKASKLSADSRLHGEIEKIAASHAGSEARALAALKLVQDRVRYVFVGLGTGGYTPATADQTWERKYGDCKGKTALLLAILAGLNIPSEAVLVRQGGVDGAADRLPSPGMFDHVLVRATIDGKTVWLDGTLSNAPKFRFAPVQDFRSVLALRSAGAPLESVQTPPLDWPVLTEFTDIDASAGFDNPARVTTRRMLTGVEVTPLRLGLGSLSGTDLKRVLREYVGYPDSNKDTDETKWSFDDETGALSLQWSGFSKLDWDGDDPAEKSMYLPGAGFTPPDELVRPADQDQAVPWAIDFPTFKCWITTIKLPPEQARLRWDYVSKPVKRVLGGVQYYRQATIKKGVVQTIMSRRALVPEIPAAEAKALAAELPAFDNAKSYVYQRRVSADASPSDDDREIVDPAGIDLGKAGKLCLPPVSG